VSRLATRRLIDASATLDAADRALLNIWVNRGLDDAALARMTGMSEETIAGRRTRIVEHLSAVLGLPAQDVRGALIEIVASPEVPPTTPTPNGDARPELVTPSANGTSSPPSGDTPDTDTMAAAAPETGTGSSSRRRPGRWSGLALLVMVVAVVLVVSLGSSGSGHRPGPATRPTSESAQTVPSGSPPSPSPSPSPPANRPAGQALVALPGGSGHATGTAVITGRSPHLRLNLSVRNLSLASHGHYEVWLYDSLTYSEAVGRLRTGVTHVSLRLPRDAHRYHWIDISLQPVGQVFHSGESVMRSANPLFR
jgi:hypothetical protein